VRVPWRLKSAWRKLRASLNAGRPAVAPAGFLAAVATIEVRDRGFASQIVHVDQFRGNASAPYMEIVGVAVNGELSRLRDARVLDFGCWSGVASLLISYLPNVGSVVGTDIDARSIEFARRFIQPLGDKASFALGEPTLLPFTGESFDLIVVNQVFCNMHREHYDGVVAELARLLSPRGRVLLIDGNNPDNPGVRERLLALYANMEDTQNGIQMLARERYFLRRDKSLPARELALGSCYMSLAQLDEAADRYKATGDLPDSRFDQTCLRVPRALGIAAITSPTDPRYFVDEFGRHGIECKVSYSYPVRAGLTRRELARSASFYLVGRRRRRN
jgi:SAM-dependent methyltransferase